MSRASGPQVVPLGTGACVHSGVFKALPALCLSLTAHLPLCPPAAWLLFTVEPGRCFSGPLPGQPPVSGPGLCVCLPFCHLSPRVQGLLISSPRRPAQPALDTSRHLLGEGLTSVRGGQPASPPRWVVCADQCQEVSLPPEGMESLLV